MFRRSGLVLVTLLAAVTLLAESGCNVETTARVPQPNILGTIKGGGTFYMDVSSVPEDEVCSQQGGIRQFCVSGFRSAIRGGLEKVLDAYFDGAKPGPVYRSRFKFVRFSHSPTSDSTIKITLGWQFELVNAAGQPVVQVAETTDGPELLDDENTARSAVDALLSAVMEKIAAAIEAEDFSPGTEPSSSNATGHATDDHQ